MAQSKKLSVGYLLPVVLLLGLLIAYIVFLISRKAKRTQAFQVIKEEQQTQDDTTDVRRIYDIITSVWSDLIHPDWICAIAMHETGSFTSEVFVENNNLFGMRHPEKRGTTSLGEFQGYAKYSALQDSVKDLRMWFEYNSININDLTTVDALVKAMKDREYFEASYTTYKSAVKRHLSTVTEILSQ